VLTRNPRNFPLLFDAGIDDATHLPSIIIVDVQHKPPNYDYIQE